MPGLIASRQLCNSSHIIAVDEEGSERIFHIECFKKREEENHTVRLMVRVDQGVVNDNKYLSERCAACRYFIIQRLED